MIQLALKGCFSPCNLISLNIVKHSNYSVVLGATIAPTSTSIPHPSPHAAFLTRFNELAAYNCKIF